jgi:hypothetical protein
MREDAAALAPSYAPRLTADDLMGLARWEFAMRPLVDGQTLAPLTGTTLPLPPAVRDGSTLAEASRQRHGRPRGEVETALAARAQAEETPAKPKPSDKRRDDKDAGEPGTGRRTFGRRRKSTDESGGQS